jgi:protein O-mannosyl-transferase
MSSRITPPSATEKIAADLPEFPKMPGFFTERSQNAAFLILIVLCSVLYGNTLGGDYVLDDILVLRDNTLVVQGLRAIPRLLTTTHMYGYLNVANDLYRPLSLVMFAVEYQFFGADPLVGHLMNLIFFIGCVLLFYRFAALLFGPEGMFPAFAAAVIFAVHPIHTEVVANIKSRDELMCYFFSLSALLLFVSFNRTARVWSLICGSICFFLALLSKETAITIVGIAAVLFFVSRPQQGRRAIWSIAGMALPTVAFLIIRYWVIHRFQFATTNSTQEFAINALYGIPSPWDRLATEILVLGKYLKLLFIPYPLLCFYSYSTIPIVSFADPLVLLSAIVWLGLAVVAVVRIRRDRKDILAFGIVFFIVTISVTSNIFFLIGSEMSERFLFLPSTGFCLVLAFILGRIYERAQVPSARKIFVITLLLLGGVYSGITMARNKDWSSNDKLYEVDVANAPNDCRLNQFYAVVLMHRAAAEKDATSKRALYVEAIGYLDHALSVYPEFPEAHTQLGMLYETLGMHDSAIQHDKLALKANQVNSLASNALAGVYYAQKKFDDAIMMYRRTLDIDPNLLIARVNMAHCFQEAGHYDSAVLKFREVLRFEPNHIMSLQCMAQSFYMLHEPDSAALYFGKVIQLKPDDEDDWKNKGVALMTADRKTEAISHFVAMTVRFPASFNAWYDLAILYRQIGDFPSSNACYLKLYRPNSSDPTIVEGIAANYRSLGHPDSARLFELHGK